MEIKKYPDGSSYAIVPDTEPQVSYGQDFTFRINSYEDLWHLNQIVDAWNNIGIYPTVTIPNLIDAQADRRFADNQSSGLKLVCEFLDNMSASFRVFHPHNPEVIEALMHNVEIIDNTELIETVIHRLDDTEKNSTNVFREFGKTEIGSKIINNLTLMSSDAGGFKPLMKLCDKLKWQGEVFSASKARSWSEKDGTEFVQQIDRDDFGGKDVLIIDDISVYGGTFKGLSKLLRERNVGNLYLAVSHMTVQDLGNDPVTNYFDRVFTTNSKFETYSYPFWAEGLRISGESTGQIVNKRPANLEVIKIFDK